MSPEGQNQSKFFGKYRAVVANNVDPLFLGRILVKCPDVFGDLPSGFCLPCLPYGGTSVGMCMVPAVGASVWIEFEQGDSRKPIWTGCFWELTAQVPTEGFKPLPTNFVIKTPGKSLISIDDSTLTVKLKTITGNEISMSPMGITLKSGLCSIDIMPSGIGIQAGPAGPKISIDALGIEISTGLPPPTGSSVKLTGPMVAVNGESFKVIG